MTHPQYPIVLTVKLLSVFNSCLDCSTSSPNKHYITIFFLSLFFWQTRAVVPAAPDQTQQSLIPALAWRVFPPLALIVPTASTRSPVSVLSTTRLAAWTAVPLHSHLALSSHVERIHSGLLVANKVETCGRIRWRPSPSLQMSAPCQGSIRTAEGRSLVEHGLKYERSLLYCLLFTSLFKQSFYKDGQVIHVDPTASISSFQGAKLHQACKVIGR